MSGETHWPRRVAAGGACLLAAMAATAQPLRGSATLGARTVDVSGTMSKYREDINLDDGVRVFDVNLSYRPEEPGGPVDDVYFVASHLGGDPFESLHLSVRKFGAYRLELDRQQSDYFYQDTILPLALASVTGSTGGDLHHFNFQRIRESALLDIEVSPATRVSLNLERQTRIGESTTTLDVERDEFEFDKPLDEKREAIGFDIQQRWDKVTLIFEEELSDFDNVSETFLPGASPGLNVGDPAELQFFFLDQAISHDGRAHVLRAVANPVERLDVSAMWRRQDLDLEIDAAERSLGTGFAGLPLATDSAGAGSGRQDTEFFVFDLGFTLGPRVRLVSAYRASELDQAGSMLFGADEGIGQWRIDTDGLELGAEVGLGARTLLAAGWSTETRDVDFAWSQNGAGHGEEPSTQRDGFFARISHRTDGGLELNASVEDNSIDDPFTLTAPRDSRRYRTSLRYAFENGIGIQGSHRRTDVDNDLSGWMADTTAIDFRLSYRHDDTEVAVGTSRIEADRAIDQLVTGGTIQAPFPIRYSADARQHDLSLRTAIADRVTLGGSYRIYENRGSYPLDREDFRISADIAMTGMYAVVVNYRDIDYVEDAFDAYDAKLLELGIRLDF